MVPDSNAKSVQKCADQSTNSMFTFELTRQDAFTAGANLKTGNSFKSTSHRAHEKMESSESQNEMSRSKKNVVHSNANFVTENT